ncbi:transposase DNA-binding-containing protein [Legionella adelaidensis]|uniref:transposase DNA-binding-containing protein n=1 Tax=Legionella adelaidensis TaxID=45056 RepID=UPI00138F112B
MVRVLFSQCYFNDKRLTRHLTQIGNQLLLHTGCSLLSSSEGDEIKIEGSYRLLRFKRVTAQEIGVVDIKRVLR